jgi:phage gpG-like protein
VTVATIVFKGSRAELRRVIAELPTVLAGRAADTSDVSRGFQTRLSVSLLSQIQQDFLVMSRGGTSRWGEKWAPLKPETIARRRTTKAEIAAFKRARKEAIKAGRKPPTKAQYFGRRQVDILRDTGKLLRSLTPGIEEPPTLSGSPGQIVRTGAGNLIVGTNVPYAEYHQQGTNNMTARPLWPQDGSIPEAYVPAISRAAIRGILAAYLILLTRGRP